MGFNSAFKELGHYYTIQVGKKREVQTDLGHAVAQLVEALRYKPEGRGFDSRMVSLEFFIVIILPPEPRPWG